MLNWNLDSFNGPEVYAIVRYVDPADWIIDHVRSKDTIYVAVPRTENSEYVFQTTYSVLKEDGTWRLVIADFIETIDGACYSVSRTVKVVSTLVDNIELAESYHSGEPLIPKTELAIDPPY